VKDAHGSVLPTTVGGAKSSAKYLDRVFGSLRAISSERSAQTAIATLERLLRLWIKDQADKARDLVRSNKISWGTVLNAGAPTETIKKKKEEFTRIKSPSKPSKSPFLSGKERTALSELLNPEWNWIDTCRIKWSVLSPQEQHNQYSSYVADVKRYYEKINKVSSTIHAKLGHRKRWIHSACTYAGVEPKNKKDKANQFTWSQNFFKLKTTDMLMSVALVFCPAHYLTDIGYDNTATLAWFWDLGRVANAADCTTDNCGPSRVLWEEWCERFAPNFSLKKERVPDALSISDDNPFRLLASTSSKEVPKGEIPEDPLKEPVFEGASRDNDAVGWD
jgi:hypothetical protein